MQQKQYGPSSVDVKNNFLNQCVTAKIYRTVLLVHTNIIMKLTWCKW